MKVLNTATLVPVILWVLLLFVIIGIFAYRAGDKSSKGQSYVACGCGCCGGSKPVEKCLYRFKGDDMSKVIEIDKKSKMSNQCMVVGCSMGTLYKYCDWF